MSQLYCHGLFISKQAELDLCFDAMKQANHEAPYIGFVEAFGRFINRALWAKENGLL